MLQDVTVVARHFDIATANGFGFGVAQVTIATVNGGYGLTQLHVQRYVRERYFCQHARSCQRYGHALGNRRRRRGGTLKTAQTPVGLPGQHLA